MLIFLQALEVIKQLKHEGTFKIQKAQMRIRVAVPGELNRYKNFLNDNFIHMSQLKMVILYQCVVQVLLIFMND